MKILSLKVSRFRTHDGDEPIEINFDPNLHVICGPNESGKSTLMDALSSCLFEKANLTGKNLDAMKPHSGAKPHIEVTLDVDGTEYTVSKHFKGQSGTCELLQKKNGRLVTTLNGTEAEDKLNEILGVPSVGRGDRKPDQYALWRLLMIQQGKSTDLPTESLNTETQDELQKLLMSETGQALTTREEAAWISSLESQVSELFTGKNEKPRSGSPVAELQNVIARDEALLASAHDIMKKVEKDSDLFTQNSRRIDELKQREPGLKSSLSERMGQKEKCDQIDQQLERTKQEKAITTRDLEKTRSAIGEMLKLKKAIDARDAQVVECDGHIRKATAQLDSLTRKKAEQSERRALAEASLQTLRRLKLRAQAHADALQAQDQLNKATGDWERAKHVSDKRKELKNRLAAMTLSEHDLDVLEKKAGACERAEASLEAASAKVGVRSTHSITIQSGKNRSEIAAGTDHFTRIDQGTKLTIGDGIAEIEITPGGEDLELRRSRVVETTREFNEQLSALGVDSLDQAKQRVCDRQNTERDLNEQESAIKILAPKGLQALQAAHESAEQDLISARAEVDQHTVEGDELLPDQILAAKAYVRNKGDAERDAETLRDSIDDQLRLLEQEIGSSTTDCEVAKQRRESLTAENTTDEVELRLLVEKHVSEENLQKTSDLLLQQVGEFDQKLKRLEQERKELQPELIDAEIQRLQKAKRSIEQDLRDLENTQNQLQGRLTASEAVGLHERIGGLTAKLADSRERLSREQLRADGLKLLLDTVTACREAVTRQLVEPLREKVSPLLRIMFGDAQLDFSLDEGTKALSLRPLARGSVSDPFDRLSAGAREQLGVAIRLALAQVLAQSHGGKLPVVLDEPFVNTDSIRRSRVLTMLNAVRRDLQVIVLTCDFDDYRDLGLDSTQVSELCAKR